MTDIKKYLKSTEVKKYLESVGGAGHMSALEIIEKLDKENKALKQSRDELLEALKLSVETEIDEGYVFKDSIQRAEATKETMKGGETNHEKD